MKIGDLINELRGCEEEKAVWNNILNYLNRFVTYDNSVAKEVMIEPGVGTVGQEPLLRIVEKISGYIDPLVGRIEEIQNMSAGDNDGKKDKNKGQGRGNVGGDKPAKQKGVGTRRGIKRRGKDGG